MNSRLLLEMNLLRILGSAFLFAAGASAKITDCSNGGSVLKLTELTLSPDPPVRGELLDMTVKFDNPGPEIVDGTVTTSVTLNFIPFAPTVEALCTNTQCPLVTGANDRSTSSTWPTDVNGQITSKIVWESVTGEQLLCIQMNVQVKAEDNSTAKLRGAVTHYTQRDADWLAYMWWPVGLNVTDMLAAFESEFAQQQQQVQSKCGLYENKAVGPWLNSSLAAASF